MSKSTVNTILLSVLIFMTLISGCNSCRNTRMIVQNQKKVEDNYNTQLDQLKGSIEYLLSMQKDSIIKSIDLNAEAIIIIEKEIDNTNLKPTQIKQMFKQHRNDN